MTKQEFVDAVADRSGSAAARPAKRSTPCSRRSRTRSRAATRSTSPASASSRPRTARSGWASTRATRRRKCTSRRRRCPKFTAGSSLKATVGGAADGTQLLREPGSILRGGRSRRGPLFVSSSGLFGTMNEPAATPRPSPTGWPSRVGERRSQLVVGLDPRLDLLPLELRGRRPDRTAGGGRGDRALLLRDHRCGRAALRRASSRSSRSSRCSARTASPRSSEFWSYARYGGPAGDRRRQARRHRLDGPRVRGRVPRARPRVAAAGRRPDREHVPRARLARAVRRRLPPRRQAGSSASSRHRTPAAPTSRT